MKTRILLSLFLTMGISQAAVSQVIVNEFSASNDTLSISGHQCDWVELYNSGSEVVNLKGYSLSDNPKNPDKYTINEDVEIYPGGFQLILCNGIGKGLNAGFKLAGDGSEHVVWSDPYGRLIDDIAVPALPCDYSYGRIHDASGDWAPFDVSTPNMFNDRQKPLAAMPVISLKAGFYANSVSVAIDCPMPDAEIYYSTNGTAPTNANIRYTGPIKISANTVLRAVATCGGYKDSPVATATYFIGGRDINLPVVSISTDSKNFYDNKIGIYVEGTNGITGNCQDQPKNWNQNWERPVHFEYFDKAHNLVVSQDCGIKITGSCSRGNDMKSLRVIARKEYGDNRFHYKFFDKKPITEYKSIVFRNGGNDFGGTMLRDALITGLVGESLNVDVQGYQPAAVFLNGEYLGLHNLREKVSTHYVEENYGADADLVDLLEYDGTIIDGDNAGYKALREYARTHDLSVQANYDYVASQMDISNFIDYWCAQIYIDNEDWPNNNIKYYKVRGANTKWRWIMFGSEFSCGIYGGKPDVNSVYHSIDPSTGRLGSSQWGGELMRNLLKNDGFRNQFIQRMSYVIDHTFRCERVSAFLDSLRRDVDLEWYTHGQKWFRWWHEHDAWRNSCNDLDYWFRNRPGYIREHVRKYFGLGDSYQVDVAADCAQARFSINGSMPTADISGKYFGGAGLVISADLPEDRDVDYWEVSGKSSKSLSIFAYGSQWRYYDKGALPAWNWQSANYQDNEWPSGNSPLGYPAIKSPATTISYGNDSNNKYPTTYFRKTINIDRDPSEILSASITLKVDDGCVVYVNGQEQGRVQMPAGNVDYNTWSSTYYADVANLPENIIGIDPRILVKGDNVIAVEVHQTSGSSSDLWLDARMEIGVSDGGSGDSKIFDRQLTINPASDTKVTLVTKAKPVYDCDNRFSSVAGKIVINEVQVRNSGQLSDETNHYPAWIELYNAGDDLVDLAGLYLMDDNNEYQIPCGYPGFTMLNPKSRAVFYLDGRPEAGPQHLPLTLNPDKENRIYLGEKVKGQNGYVDWVEVPAMKKGLSYGRKVDGGKEYVTFQKPTPYSANKDGEILPEIPLYTPVSDIQISDIGNALNIIAYPNPARDLVHLSVNGDTGNISYDVLSLSGSPIMSGQGNMVDLSGLQSAVYVIRVKVGGITQGVKIIKR